MPPTNHMTGFPTRRHQPEVCFAGIVCVGVRLGCMFVGVSLQEVHCGSKCVWGVFLFFVFCFYFVKHRCSNKIQYGTQMGQSVMVSL